MERLFQQPLDGNTETPLTEWLRQHAGILRIEPKWDGERVFLYRKQGVIKVVNRNGYDYQPILNWEVPALPEGAILDGELVTPENKVYAISRQLKKPEVFCFIAFDYVQDSKLLSERRRDLEALKPQLPDFVQLVEQRTATNEQGIRELYAFYVSIGFEGIVVKANQAYLTKGSWLKLKKTETHDLIVTGVSKKKASILLSAYVNGVLEDICSCSILLPKDRFLTLMQPLKIGEDVNFIRYKPEVVLEVRAQEITTHAGGISLRNPVPLRFRNDKPIEECKLTKPPLSTRI